MMQVKSENLRKEFDGTTAVDDVSFEARPGVVFGILGPPHSGKTTILRMLLDMVKPDKGSIFFDEKTMTLAVRNTIGYLPEKRGLYQKYTLNKILIYFARLKNLSRKKSRVEAVRLMDRFGMIEQMDVMLSQLPEELQQKVQIMVSIIHNPDLLILDEPFTGFEPANQKLIRQMIQHFQEEGKTIILAADQLKEAESICDDVILLDQGKVILEDNIKQIQKRFKENLILVEAADNLKSLQDIYGVKKLIQEKQVARLYIDEQVPTQKILDIIVKSVKVSRLEVMRPNLNDIFLQVTQGRKKGGA